MHRFTFFRAGGFDQVRLATAADLAAIAELDRTLWAALACPVQGLEIDERTLALIDTDSDGRVRAPELVAAVRWTQERLTDLGAIIPGNARLPLAAIVPAQAALAACARRVLEKAGKTGAVDIGLDEIAAAAGELAKTRFNGDGVLPPTAAGDAVLAAAITDIAGIRPPVLDRGGEPGLDRATWQAFQAEAAAWLTWWDGGRAAPGLLPLGEVTPAAWAAVQAVRAKVDDWFLRCGAAAFDARAGVALARSEADWQALAGRDLGSAQTELATFPLAAIAVGTALPLAVGVNPAWSARLDALRRLAVAPLLGDRASLDEAAWHQLIERLSAYAAWSAAEPGTVGRLGATRLRELLAPVVQAGLDELFRQDQVVEPEFAALTDLERLVRYHRDLYRILQNVTAMADFYDPRRMSLFQAGTLFFGGRAIDLCVRVTDAARHGQLAGRSHCALLYCDCTRAGARMAICAAVTAGGDEDLVVGRNGLFVDRQGRDWDATVTKVIEAPISIRAAFWSPYRRLVRWIEDFASRSAAEADKLAEGRLTEAVVMAARPPAVAKPKFEIGTVAALGVAVGGISAAIGALLQALFGLGYWVPLGIVGIVLAISLPAMILAWLKLRTRNLGPILDANGWAVNGNVRINIPFGATLTRVGALPPGAQRMLRDPYAERGTPWLLWVLLVVVLGAAAWTGYDSWRQGCWWWQPMR